MVIPLSHVPVGEHAVVVHIACGGDMEARLHDLGFLPGSQISCVLRKKKKGMGAFLVRNAVIALRHSTCNEILVEYEEPCRL